MEPANATAHERWKIIRERVFRPVSLTARGMRCEAHSLEVLAEYGPTTVKYWNDDERSVGVAHINEGRLHLNGDPKVSPRADALCARQWFESEFRIGYVLGRDSNRKNVLYPFRHIPRSVHHSSPMEGRPVIDAGMMTVFDGRIAYIEHKSGHYEPNREQVLYTLNYLTHAGVSLKGVYYSECVPRPEDSGGKISPEYFSSLVNTGDVLLYDAEILHKTRSFELARLDSSLGRNLDEITKIAPSPNPHRRQVLPPDLIR